MRFYQSLTDFPCPVSLGEKAPSFNLGRYKQALHFIPIDDEGFSIRGDKRQLLYKGSKRSHRFTLLCDTAFEYDCILLKEPESNVVSLLMEGSENFDFFFQPDYLKDPLLAGSIAVYKKETLIGEGTGKLCHIHRPEIIDARGRRCWGSLSIEGNRLSITIPEQWLANASYPVVVDPTIGTTTIGSQTHWNNEDSGEREQLFIDAGLAVNRYQLTETFNGNATAYVYAYDKDSYTFCKPVLYSDNGNVPLTRRSKNEGAFDVKVNNSKPAGWRSASFSSNTSLSSGTYVWYGFMCAWFAPRFDFGSKCYWDFYDGEEPPVPNTYPVWSANWYYNFKLSMYFTYTSAQNYVRTITQGVSLSDKRTIKAEYKRELRQTVKANGIIKGLLTFICNIFDTVKSIDIIKSSVMFIVKIFETSYQTDNVNHMGFQYREIAERIEAESRINAGWALFSFIADKVSVTGNAIRSLLVLVQIISKVIFRDYILSRFLKAKQELVLKSPVCRELTLESKIE